MKMKIKNIAAALTALGAAACSVLPLGAAADNLPGAEDTMYDGSFYYELNDDDTYTITKCSAIVVESVPSIRNGKAITAIADGAFAYCTGITTLDIPDSVTSIGKNAFYGCEALKTVSLPRKLNSLGDHAFFDCKSLESIEIPSTLTAIPSHHKMPDQHPFHRFVDHQAKIGKRIFPLLGKIVQQGACQQEAAVDHCRVDLA
ncbi:MAG: leucine-rich repeat domain-containing protein, partial [Ruminococcus sp.]|nr:leucine-rich repeat domain-containing protein [Ruminococcus sp.]